MKQFLFSILTFFIGVGTIQAQLDSTYVTVTDIVILKDGSKLEGHIIEYQATGNITIELISGGKYITPAVNVSKVRHRKKNKKAKNSRAVVYSFPEKGNYLNIGTYTLGSPRELGYGFQFSYGHQFSRQLGLGVYVARDTYDNWRGEILYPIGIEVRGYLRKKRMSPYYAFGAGYGFVLGLENVNNIIDASGGFMMNPRVGIRWGGGPELNFLTSIGYRFQPSHFERGPSGNVIWSVEDNYYRRFELKIAFLFH